MEIKINEIARRLKELREICEFTPEEIAEFCDIPVEQYLSCEKGEVDLGITFLYKFGKKCKVDLAELLDGKGSRLGLYQVVRHNQGIEIERKDDLHYHHLGYLLRNRNAEPLLVHAKYDKAADMESKPMHFSTHEGFEFDYVLRGSLKFYIEGHVEILNAGDSVYYHSSKSHGMSATNGSDCEFLAILMTATSDKKDR